MYYKPGGETITAKPVKNNEELILEKSRLLVSESGEKT